LNDHNNIYKLVKLKDNMVKSIDTELYSLQGIEGQIGYSIQEVRHEVQTKSYTGLDGMQQSFLILAIIALGGAVYSGRRLYRELKTMIKEKN